MKFSQNAGHVFINCPFDSQYKEIFNAIVFAVFDCGFTARCSLEVDDSSEVRIDLIFRIIRECKFGIHDISRTELNLNGLPRFNMPLELGIFLGAKRFGGKLQQEKRCLVLDREQYRYKEFISDIGGQDIKSHQNKVEICIREVRNWLNNASGRITLPGGKAIHNRFSRFLKELPEILTNLNVEEDELTFNDLINIVYGWLQTQDQFEL